MSSIQSVTDSFPLEGTSEENLKLFKCDKCGKNFSQVGSKNRHIRMVHESKNKAKIYECCGKNYKYESSYRRHQAIQHHVPENLIINISHNVYICDLCNKQFRRRDHLVRHIQCKHAEQKPTYVCNHCNRAFSVKSNLQRHLANHEENVQLSGISEVARYYEQTMVLTDNATTPQCENPPSIVLEHLYAAPTGINQTTTMGNEVSELMRVRRQIEQLEAENTILRGELKEREQMVPIIEQLKSEVETLRSELNEKDRMMRTFLNEDQIKSLQSPHLVWSVETILKSLKMRIILSKDGWDALRSTGYPGPAYSTIMRRIAGLELAFGFFESILIPLEEKIRSLGPLGHYGLISFDEMEIAPVESYDKNKDEIFGHVTLGNQEKIGKKLLLVLVRSWNEDWKQVIGAHLTDVTTSGEQMKHFILECIDKLESIGMQIVALSSDAGSNNINLWRKLGCIVSQTERRYKFQHNGHDIYIIVDVCHILKNLKMGMMANDIVLPSGEIVRGQYVAELWQWEVNLKKTVRKLFHLKDKDLKPNGYEKMKVGPAVRFFSSQTAAALEDAVSDGILPSNALPTATFIRIMEKWFEMTSAKHDFVMTKERAPDEIYFLRCVIEIFQNSQIGKSWKPLNTNVICSTLSLCELCEFFFSVGFEAVQTHKGTQDALENLNSRVRKRAGSHPNAKQCLDAIKLITVAQYVSEVRNTNYAHDNDKFLLSFIREASKHKTPRTLDYNFLCDEPFHTLQFTDIIPLFSKYDLSSLYYLAGSCTLALLKKKICSTCREVLQICGSNAIIDEVKTYTESLDRGKLIYPNADVYLVILNCHYYFSKYEDDLKENCIARKPVLIDKIRNEIIIIFPPCCDLKMKIVKHFSTFFMFATAAFTQNISKRKLVYGTASSKAHK